MKKILFIPQNPEHILNMNPVSESLELQGLNIDYVDFSKIFNQKLKFPKTPIKSFSSRRSFYESSMIDKIITLNKLKTPIKNLVSEYDAFIYGNDGAIQRLFLNEARRSKKLNFLILDGIISDYSFSFKDIINNSNNFLKDSTSRLITLFKNYTWFAFRGTRFDPYIHSIVGSSPMDEIFVIGKHTKNILEKIKCKETTIIESGLPRLYNETLNFNIHSENSINLCFISSAFKWHGLNEYDSYQHKDIETLIQFVLKQNENSAIKYHLTLKIHPRENPNDYEFYKIHSFVDVNNKISLDKIYAEFDFIFSNISTCIIEAGLKGRIINSIMINFPYWKFKNSFINEEVIHKIYDKNEFNEIYKFRQISNNRLRKRFQNDFVSNTSFEAKKIITDRIIRKINSTKDD